MTAVARGCFGTLLVLALAVPASAQDSKSAPLARQLAAALDAAKITALAVPAPAQPDSFVAALYYPGTLLVVQAKYAAAPLMHDKIAKQMYQDVYVDLQSASVAGTKVFVTDTGADGLQMKSPDSIDRGEASLTFDGDWKKSKLASEDEYNKAFTTADDDYSKMLTALIAGMKKTS
jgi:hypothetical protein